MKEKIERKMGEKIERERNGMRVRYELLKMKKVRHEFRDLKLVTKGRGVSIRTIPSDC